MKMKQNKQKFRLSPRVWLMYLIVLAVLSTGVTLSRYVTSSSGDDQAGVIRFHDIRISETGSFYEAGTLLLQPGVDLEKKAVVEFGGSEAAVYVFLTVDTENFIKQDDNMQFTALDQKIRWQIDGSWQYLLSEDQTHVYYMSLAPNTTLEQAIIRNGAVLVSDEIIRTEMQNLDSLAVSFQATAVQSDGFGVSGTEADHAKKVWDAVGR